MYTHPHTYTRAHIICFWEYFLVYFPVHRCSQGTFLCEKHSWLSDCFESIDSFLREVLLLWNQISIYTHPCPITLNYEWTHVFFLMTIEMSVTQAWFGCSVWQTGATHSQNFLRQFPGCVECLTNVFKLRASKTWRKWFISNVRHYYGA